MTYLIYIPTEIPQTQNLHSTVDQVEKDTKEKYCQRNKTAINSAQTHTFVERENLACKNCRKRQMWNLQRTFNKGCYTYSLLTQARPDQTHVKTTQP
jgi:hypothetical protein